MRNVYLGTLAEITSREYRIKRFRGETMTEESVCHVFVQSRAESTPLGNGSLKAAHPSEKRESDSKPREKRSGHLHGDEKSRKSAPTTRSKA